MVGPKVANTAKSRDATISSDPISRSFSDRPGTRGGLQRPRSVKAARIKSVADAAQRRGLVVCGAIDGKGWSERPGALLDVVLATGGRTFTLATIKNLPLVPEVATHAGTATQDD